MTEKKNPQYIKNNDLLILTALLTVRNMVYPDDFTQLFSKHEMVRNTFLNKIRTLSEVGAISVDLVMVKKTEKKHISVTDPLLLYQIFKKTLSK